LHEESKMRRVALAASIWMVLVACGDKGDPTPIVTPLPEILAAVPSAPTPADAGQPGSYEALRGIDPPARVFVVEPTGAARGSVIVVHGAWGLEAETRLLARELAGFGYWVVAPDFYDGFEPTSRVVTNEMIAGQRADRNRAILSASRARLESALGASLAPPAVIGLARGGEWALDWLQTQPDIRLAVLDSTVLRVEAFTLAPALKLVVMCGSENMSLAATRRAEQLGAARQSGIQLEFDVIEGPGNDLFDHRAQGFMLTGRAEALRRLQAWLSG
jgi:dienelactone hydrolase